MSTSNEVVSDLAKAINGHRYYTTVHPLTTIADAQKALAAYFNSGNSRLRQDAQGAIFVSKRRQKGIKAKRQRRERHHQK